MLTHLVDKSLVLLDEESVATRYRMLETIREYAMEKLAESGESETVRSRHLAYFLAFTQTVAPSSITVVQLDKWQRLEREVDNLRAALGWAMNAPDPAAALRLSAGLYVLWHVRVHYAEGRQWLEQALMLNQHLETDATAPAEDRAWYGNALRLAALFTFNQGDTTIARALYERSVSLLRQIGDKRFLAGALMGQAVGIGTQGDLATARALMEEGLALARESGNVAQIYVSLMALGTLDYHTGNYPAGQAIFADLLARAREGGYDLLISNASHMLGEAARVQGDYARARQWLEEGLAIRYKLGISIGTGPALVTLGRVALAEGRYAEAYLRLTAALALARGSEALFVLPQCLLGFVALARRVGQEQNAARWLALVDVPRPSYVPNTSDERAEFEREREALRAQLGDDVFNAAWEAGKALTLAQALSEAELLPVPEPATLPTPSPMPKHDFGGLTPREREVAMLVAQGLSNREIAESLVIGERTVESHVSSIFNKLGFTARSQVRKWAKEKGL
jgi:ATP/maltotriose-dependent transcriptional regulator MalT